MRISKSFNALAGFVMLLATSAFAAQKGLLHISSLVEVAGERLTTGDYSVLWEGTGPSVEVKIMQGEKILATVPAKVTSLSDVSSNDAIRITAYRDGSQRLSQIFFAGKALRSQFNKNRIELKSSLTNRATRRKVVRERQRIASAQQSEVRHNGNFA